MVKKGSSKIIMPPITDSYIYNQMNNYTGMMTNAILKSERIDKNTTEFLEDVSLELKRTKSPIYMLKILNSKNTHLLLGNVLPRPIKVFAAKDIKRSKQINAFIDCTNVITPKTSGRYKVDTAILIAYLISAKHNMMYYMMPKALINKSANVQLYTRIFAKLFTHVIDYLGNISVVPENREKMLYISSKYFLQHVIHLDDDNRIKEIALKSSGITTQQQHVFELRIEELETNTLPTLISTVKDVFKLPELTIALVIEKWMYLYGSGSVLSMEFLPSFLTMITDAYCGVYLNNQKSIEKIVSKDLVVAGKNLIYDETTIL